MVKAAERDVELQDGGSELAETFGFVGGADWLEVAGIVTAGNLVGGLGLVTLLRLVQVGPRRIAREARGS